MLFLTHLLIRQRKSKWLLEMIWGENVFHDVLSVGLDESLDLEATVAVNASNRLVLLCFDRDS